MEPILLCEFECAHCRHLFYQCRGCYRGHKYCSDQCRKTAQRQSHRQAQRQYRQTEKGRAAHRKAERRRRLGKSRKKIRSEKTMADEGTTTALSQTTLCSTVSNQTPHCRFCGVRGTVVSHFPRRGYGSRPINRQQGSG